MELTEAISDYLAKKLGTLEKFLDPKVEAMARVEMGRTTNHHHKGDVYHAEINLEVGKEIYRAEAQTSDLYAAIDMMKDEVAQEVIRNSKKKRHMLKRGHQKIKDLFKGFRG